MAETTDYFAGDPRTNRERMLAGDNYIADDPENAAEAQRAVRLANQYLAAYSEDPVAARGILADLIGTLGDDVEIKPPLFVDYGSFISIGAGTFINYNFTALDVAPITIGRDCQVGPNVQLLTPTHPIDPRMRRDKLEAAKPISIGDNVWLGGVATIAFGLSTSFWFSLAVLVVLGAADMMFVEPCFPVDLGRKTFMEELRF